MSEYSNLAILCSTLPSYCMAFFTAKDETLGPRTKTAYAGDLNIFFYWLTQYLFKDKKATEITLSDLDSLTYDDINTYVAFLTEYTLDDKVYKNTSAGKKRKIACLKTFFKYLLRSGKISSDPVALVEIPRVKEKEILILSSDEKSKMLEQSLTGSRKTERQKKFHEKTKYRDFAILTLFLSTGLRVSELVGINNYDLDLEQQRVYVTRKGGKHEYIYFNKEALDALCDYLDFERNELLGYDNEVLNQNELPDGPLFVSLKHERISVRMVEIIVKKYAKCVLPVSVKVTPHVLRKTYGSELYYKYRDLALVQHALGHSSPQTTAKHYTKFDPEYLAKLKEF